MRWICLWCSVLAAAAHAQLEQDDGFYAPQTFRNHMRAYRQPILFMPMQRPLELVQRSNNIDSYAKGLFTPSGGRFADASPQGSIESWRPAAPAPVQEPWREYAPAPTPVLPQPQPWRAPQPSSWQPPQPAWQAPKAEAWSAPKAEPWQAPYPPSKEQKATILHHKQALSSEGSFKFEYASDNGLAAGEVIEPDGSRVGAYQYKDPNGQLVKLKYRAGKDGFQILEGSHLPKSPEPVAPQTQEQHHHQAYEQQRQQYQLQQQYNNQPPQQQNQWKEQNYDDGSRAAAGQHSWRAQGQEDDGQYRENEVEDAQNRGPHTFGEGYAFEFQG